MAFTTRPTLSGSFGMVSSTHYLATATAMSVLERGGNAVDASVAGAFVLHVVEPHLNGPGGDAPILLSVRGGEPRVLCGQGPAPAGASAQAYLDLGLELVPGTGPLAAAIPGAVDAWLTLLRDEGTWELADVLDHAIGLAERGHHPIPQIGRTVASVETLFSEHWPTSAAQWLGAGFPDPGRLLRNPALAVTWTRLIAGATGATREARIDAALAIWRQGWIAEAMAESAAIPVMDASGSRHAGMLTIDDLATYEATWEPTVSHDWGPWTVHKADQWTQGPSMLQQLAMLADVEPGSLAPDGFTADVIHRLVESTKLVMADRDAWYGDAEPTPLASLLDPAYSQARRALIGSDASLDWRPGTPTGVHPGLPAHISRLLTGEATERNIFDGLGERRDDASEPVVDERGRTRGDTCHIDVVDRWGTMVAATPSGGWLQSNPTIPTLGFCLGTRLQMSWLDDGLPNTLTPGRRPRTTLTPSIASFEGVPTLAFGTPGGDQQDQWSTHLFLHLADEFARSGVLDLQGGCDAPNWHTDHLIGSFWPRGYEPGTVTLEANHPARVAADLRSRGHRVQIGPEWSEGRLCAVARHPRTGALLAGANPRGMQGYAAGR
ncbi:MAG TPA: gamma-glutamyltransferase [Propionibacteriaceae bacterium]|nr:gamma-glutamyltransferase [Propionibacteriaceae bacterium]